MSLFPASPSPNTLIQSLALRTFLATLLREKAEASLGTQWASTRAPLSTSLSFSPSLTHTHLTHLPLRLPVTYLKAAQYGHVIFCDIPETLFTCGPFLPAWILSH